jgi:hypothetical protein
MKNESFLGHPFWIFWIGLLTGALIVGLLFSYQAIERQNLQDAYLKGGFTTTPINTIDWPGGL